MCYARFIFHAAQTLVSYAVLHIEPCHSSAHLLGGYVLALAFHIRHGAPVAVFGLGGDRGLLLEAEFCQVLARHLAEWLGLLWRINRAYPYPHLFIGARCAAASGQGIAICNGDN